MEESQETQVRSLGCEETLEEMAIHSSILAWKIPWTEEPGGQAIVHGVAKRWTWLSTPPHHTHTDIYKMLYNFSLRKACSIKKENPIFQEIQEKK